MVAHVADTTRFCPWPSDLSTAGCTWWDAPTARNAALGEAVERYCGNLVPSSLSFARHSDWCAAGVAAVAPAAVPLFSSAQYAERGFPFTPFTDDLAIHWTEARDMRSNEPCLVPASLVYVTYPRAEGPTRDASLTNPVIAAGIATGATCEEAECVALEELIERDAVTVAWLAGEQLERVVIPDQMAALFAGPAASLDTTIIYFPNPYQLPVLGALVYDRKTALVTLGTACRPHPLDAMLKAYAEAAQLQMLAYALDDPNSPLLQAVQRIPNSPLKPWRADRCYSQSYRSDWRDVTDLLCQLQLYLDPSMKVHLDEYLRNATLRTFDQLPKGRSRERTDYLECLRAVPTPLFAVDVTTADVAACGLWVVRVVAPGLCTNTPAAFPLLGNQRIQSLQKLHRKRPPLPYA